MLESDDYKRINMFKDAVHKHHFLDSEFNAFRKKVAATLGEIFGYHHVIFGYINFQGNKELNLNIAIYNIKQDFIQKFFTSNIIREKNMIESSDIIILSERSNYKKSLLYKELLTEYDYSDFMLFYLRISDVYNGYIIVFKDKSQKLFTSKDKEIIENIKDYISVEYYNYTSILKLKNLNDLLVTQTNYYPIGIVIMKDLMSFSYANETAIEFMKEMEISNPKFFSVFYNNYIVPNIKFDMVSFGKKHIVKYKNFIFNIVTSDPFSKNYFIDLEKSQHSSDSSNLLNSYHDITSYIYILKDELSSFNKSKDYFEEYSFSRKEKEIVELLLLGNDAKQISQTLTISINTVKVHIQNIYRKTNVTNRTEFLFKMNNTM